MGIFISAEAKIGKKFKNHKHVECLVLSTFGTRKSAPTRESSKYGWIEVLRETSREKGKEKVGPDGR